MALYRVEISPVSRSPAGGGRSAVSAAAYRAGVLLVDGRTGESFDYNRKGGVLFSRCVGPDGGPIEDLSALWTLAESAEKRKDARVAREILIALPWELLPADKELLVIDIQDFLCQEYGVAVQANLHSPALGGDWRNYHAHLLMTTRKVERLADGKISLKEKSDLELSDKKRRELGLPPGNEEVEKIRATIADKINRALEQAGREVRVDHRSYRRQGLDIEPQIHLGPAATALERQGVQTRVGEENRERRTRNRARLRIAQELAEIDRQKRVLEAEKQALEERARQIEEAARKRHVQRDAAALLARLADRQTERDTGPGVRHPDKPRWQEYRERVLTLEYNEVVAQALGRYYHIDREPTGALVLSNKESRLTDRGDRISVGHGGTDREVEALVLLAQAKGWKTVTLTGSSAFQEKAGRAFLEAGFALADMELHRRLQQTMEAERLAAAERERQRLAEKEAAERQERERKQAEMQAAAQTQKPVTGSFSERLVAAAKRQPLSLIDIFEPQATTKVEPAPSPKAQAKPEQKPKPPQATPTPANAAAAGKEQPRPEPKPEQPQIKPQPQDRSLPLQTKETPSTAQLPVGQGPQPAARAPARGPHPVGEGDGKRGGDSRPVPPPPPVPQAEPEPVKPPEPQAEVTTQPMPEPQAIARPSREERWQAFLQAWREAKGVRVRTDKQAEIDLQEFLFEGVKRGVTQVLPLSDGGVRWKIPKGRGKTLPREHPAVAVLLAAYAVNKKDVGVPIQSIRAQEQQILQQETDTEKSKVER